MIFLPEDDPTLTNLREARGRMYQAVADLVELLTGAEGCPWDRQQRPEDLAHYLAEECRELAEALDSGDRTHAAEEWGDVLFLVLFFAHTAEQADLFEVPVAVEALLSKMVRRHPHVFDTAAIEHAEGVARQWKAIKERERELRERTGLLDQVPPQFSALRKAHAVQGKAAEIGFDWTDAEGVWQKVQEEMAELVAAWERRDSSAMLDEMGDLHFALVNLGRHSGVQPEEPLNRATNRFIERFRIMERMAEERGVQLAGLSLVELDALWELAKAETQRSDPQAEWKVASSSRPQAGSTVEEADD